MSFAPESLSGALKDLVSRSFAEEAAILSTCNRTELYVLSPDSQRVLEWFAEYKNVDFATLSKHIYQHRSLEACEHVLRVSSGLDSMVLGETQILGQLKTAFRIAEQAGTVGAALRAIFENSYSSAKLIRTDTKVGANSVSLPSAALRVAKKIFGKLDGSKILFIGAGEMIRVCAEYFSETPNGGLCFSNRTIEKASTLADTHGAGVVSIDNLQNQLKHYDVIVTCTSSQFPIVRTRDVIESMQARKNRPMLFLDLSVPRDVEPSIADVASVFVYTIDDLGQIVREAEGSRSSSLIEAEELIGMGMVELKQYFSRREVAPIIKTFRDHGEKIADLEVEKAIKELSIGKDPEEVLKKFARSLAARFMHQPSRALNSVDDDQRELLARALVILHGLDSNT